MNFQKENAVRKIDASGRIIIPKSLRDRLKVAEGDEMEFYTISDNGVEYIGLTKNGLADPRLEIARAVLEELGIEPPQLLIKKIKGQE